MLTFFRRIRKGLLDGGTDDVSGTSTKNRRYLVYAIGEILLVMIGILLALQVNNWNEDRINRQAEKVMLNEIKNNLTQDLDDLDYNVKVLEGVIKSLQIVVEHLENELAYHDSLDTHFGSLSILLNFYSNPSAFEGLKSTGVDLISNDTLRGEIIDYFTYSYSQLNVMEGGFLNPMYHYTIIPFMMEHFNFQIFGDAKPNAYTNLITNNKALSVFKSTSFLYGVQLGRTRNTRDTAKALFNRIERELNESFD